jgi:two-component system chemotaxis response regulator CheY
MAATILLVDDSRTILMAVGLVLSRTGLTIVKTGSGEEALTKLQKVDQPDLMITDLNMAVMNGIDLIRNARKLPSMRSTPILICSAESGQYIRNEAKSAGASGWIVKPVHPDALLQVVRQVLQ